ncbi:12379_t:CDS:2, partial [Funneliformis geosporum]
TLETAPEQSTSEITTPIIMDIDQTPSLKGKEKEVEVTEIPLDTTVHQIKIVFSKYETIVKFNMEMKNMWQQATITFAENTDFKKLAACHSIFVLNDMVRVHGCDLPKKDILAKSKFLAKLAGLPRFTTGKQLLDIEHMVNAMAWIIPK